MDMAAGQQPGYETPPLERRTIDLNVGNGVVKKVPALNKSFAPAFKYIDFYLPKLDILETNPSILEDWVEYMRMLRDDLKWLLKLPHHKFWSTMIYSVEISDCVLPSFLLQAPRFFEPEFERFQSHPIIAPLYNDIYTLVFRIYLRLSTFKENREDHISPETWAGMLYDNYLFDLPKIMDLCALYESKDNNLLPKMIENVFKHQPKYVQGMDLIMPITIDKSVDLGRELELRVRSSQETDNWEFKLYQEILTFIIDGIVALYKFLKVYPPLSEYFHRGSHFETSLTTFYEKMVTLWSEILHHIPYLEAQVHALRIYVIRLFRTVLYLPTLGSASSSTDPKIDDFFDTLTKYIDEKYFIHDYEKAYPFKCDMQTLLSRGIYVDETRIDYLANAMSSCFQMYGENYPVEKKVTDPLYDPHFDRQLLGACSLDVTGVELQSLISQVKDLLPDTPDSYIEVCLKHYGYSTETTINALLEGAVPESFEKYKDPVFLQQISQSQAIHIRINDEPIRDDLPTQIISSNSLQHGNQNPEPNRPEGFFKPRTSKRPEDTVNVETVFEGSKILKERILRNLQADAEASAARALENIARPYRPAFEQANSYLDESDLPTYSEDIEYNDEYDDTYDEAGVGMTEPDNIPFKPLNFQAHENSGTSNHNDDGILEEEIEPDHTNVNRNDNFAEDPAIIRARLENKRMHKFQQQNPRRFAQQGKQDVVGKAKGQGQDKEVMLNRRLKDQAGSHNRKKGSDWKRREF